MGAVKPLPHNAGSGAHMPCQSWTHDWFYGGWPRRNELAVGRPALARASGKRSRRIVREALRRAVDVRDSESAKAPSGLSARPVFLVDVLNKLCEVLNVSTERLWDEV